MNPTSLRVLRRRLLTLLALALVDCTAAEIQDMRQTTVAPDLLGKIQFDTGCPPGRIQVLRWGPNAFAADVDVCGQVRRYQNLAGTRDLPNWLDVTLLREGGPAIPSSSAPLPDAGPST